MGLSFTTIDDQEGAAIYIIYGSHPRDLERAQEIHSYCSEHAERAQAVIIDEHSDNARKIMQFYQLGSGQLPLVLLVRDNDQLAAHWYNNQLRRLDEITYQANRI